MDKLPENSLLFAQIQAEMGISGTYYFRVDPQSWNEEIITNIASMGHEMGYHYENMDTASRKLQRLTHNRQPTPMKYTPSSNFTGQATDNIIDIAYEDFQKNLEILRELVPVTTICMHGSPRSKYDNKAIWGKYNYKTLGITGEPYFDVDFGKTFYLTDTGRRWDGWKVSIRDKVPQQEKWVQKGLVFHSTTNIINAVRESRLPGQVLFTFHPQRWHNSLFPWVKELVVQKAKNQVKRILVKSSAQ
ncbi:MAG: hypothetical protein PF489_14510 [Salinivirgaceae bacterium]|nr:hypothetical protein [Salinivirgaceae bacterium]